MEEEEEEAEEELHHNDDYDDDDADRSRDGTYTIFLPPCMNS